jgi:acyl-CoA synthetase (AMP-forming)/AMP-acid ligase II
MTLAYAVHRLNGVLTPANAAYSAPELEYQLKSAGAKALFTCMPLLETSLQAAKAIGIPNKHIYILEMPKEITGGKSVPFRSLDDLLVDGRKLKKLEPLKWTKGQGARQTAFLCYSSGTSGLPVCMKPLFLQAITNLLPPERGHDFPPERDFKCHANRYIRVS